MRVSVFQSRMGMQVGMACFGVREWFSVGVVMVTIDVSVAMFMLDGGMAVEMVMAFTHQQPGSCCHKRNGNDEEPRDGFSEKDQRQPRTYERC